jgi:hypothetical protein
MRRKAHTLTVNPDGVIALNGDLGTPAALHGVEFKKMRGGQNAAFDFVEMDHIKTIRRMRIIGLPVSRSHGSAQCKTADAAHAIDTYFQDNLP